MYKPTMPDHSAESSREGESSLKFGSGRVLRWLRRVVAQHRGVQARSSEVNPHEKVIIVGAGLGGLLLAQGLKQRGIPFTVYERDPSAEYRAQGYCIQINTQGLGALEYALPPALFQQFLHVAGRFKAGFTFLDARSGREMTSPEDATLRPKLWQVFSGHHHEDKKNVVAIDRSVLRNLLLSGLEEGREIRFGMVFHRFVQRPEGGVQVHFENGQVEHGGLLVGADGANSRVRRQYIPHAACLMDTDGRAIFGKTPLRTVGLDKHFEKHDTVLVTNKEPYMTLLIEPIIHPVDRETRVSEGIEEEDYLYWVLFTRSKTIHRYGKTTDELLFALDRDEIAGLSRQLTYNWAPRIRSILENQVDDACSFVKLSSMTPDIESWEPTSVTLLGDAIHAMTPAGIGCNAAFQDARLLIRCLLQRGLSIKAVESYEKRMRKYGRKAIVASARAGRRIFDQPPFDDMNPISYFKSKWGAKHHGALETENWYQGNHHDDPEKLAAVVDHVLHDDIA